MAGSEERVHPSAVPAPRTATGEGGSHLWRRLVRALNYAILPLGIVVVWQAVVELGLVPSNLLPPPTRVIASWMDLMFANSGEAGRYSGVWMRHATASFWRVYLGFGIAGLAGIITGLLIGLYRPMERLLDPTVQVVRNIPITAWVPLSIVFFGIADRPAIFLIALGAFFPTVLNTTHGVKQVNPLFVKAGLMMGVNRWQLVTRIIIPAALPSIFTGIRLSMGIAWVLVVVAEMIAVKSGLGYLLFDSYQFFRTDIVIAAMFSIGILGFLSDRLILAVRHSVLAWNRLETMRG